MDVNDRRQRAAEEAAEWWVVLQGEVSRTRREQYVDWLRESSSHVAEMLRVAQVHVALAQFDRWARIPSDGLDDENVASLPPPPRSLPLLESSSRPRRRVNPVWSLAAACIVAVVCGAALLYEFRDPVIQTERAERRAVSLNDGSVVQLDPESRLRVEYEEHARRVVLERGRALFHVAKNRERPFVVHAAGTAVRAVGTAFAVERQSESVVVTVAEGEVAVFPGGSSPGTAAAAEPIDSVVAPTPRKTGASPKLLLTANEQVTVGRSGSAAPVRNLDSDRELAWAEGRLIFDNESVSDAIKAFNRYNRIQLYVGDAEIGQRRISGVFSAADPESFVAFIQSVAAVRVIRSSTADITIDSVK